MRKYCYEYHYYHKATVISWYNNTGTTADIIAAIQMKYLNKYETLRQALINGEWFSGRYYTGQSHQFKTIYKYYKIMG